MAKVVEAKADERLRDLPCEPLGELTADTTSRYLVGTPAYMAPEQLRNEPASFASDIFSLGMILYELLALRLPWNAQSISELQIAQRFPPENPTRLQRGRDIPWDLGRVALTALEHDPKQRFKLVSDFAREVARALEGSASWRLERSSQERDNWILSAGRMTEDRGEIMLQSRRPESSFGYFCTQRYTDDVCVELEFSFSGGAHELSVWLNATMPRRDFSDEGYRLVVLPGKRRTLSLFRSGRLVAGSRSPAFEQRRWYRVAVAREDDSFSLRINGDEIYAYQDPIPLAGGLVGLTGQGAGLRIRELRISSRGTSATISCLSVPAAFFNRKLYEEARAEYERIVVSHPGRNEARLACFRAGLCLLELARQESDEEVRSLWLSEAQSAFSSPSAASDSCLAHLGLAMVAREQGNAGALREALSAAFQRYSDDAHLPAVREWVLGQLNALSPLDRRALAEILPLAVSHCMTGWGSQFVRDLVNEVRHDWEMPSFMTARGRFKEHDPVSRAELQLFFGFWTGSDELIARSAAELIAAKLLRPHHLADAVFSFLELGKKERAGEILKISQDAENPEGPKMARIETLCRAALQASRGEIAEAEALFASCEPDPSERAYNSARMWVARASFESGLTSRTFRFLRRSGPQDSLAREQEAWLHLHAGDAERAEKQLHPFLERGDHRHGRNLSNFLYGVCLLLRKREEEALHVFAYLPPVPWPRTWTLGSHHALGRLGGGKLKDYLAGSFLWERMNLRRQAALLARARGEPEEAIPEELRGEVS